MTPPPPNNVLLPPFLAALRRHGHVTFVLADNLQADGLPACGLVDRDSATIVLDRANSVGEMAATIGHELHHLAHPDASEDDVEELTAQLLVPLDDAMLGQTGGDLTAVAELHGVDVQLVRARLRRAPTIGG